MMGREMREGMTVIGLDGETFGEVSGTDGEFVLVKGSGAFGTEYQVPRSAIAEDEGETLRLHVTTADAIEQRWPGTPAGEM